MNVVSDREQVISITFLSRDAASQVCKVRCSGDVSAYCSPLLERQDLDVWVCRLFVTGRCLYDLTSSGQITLNISGYITQMDIQIDITSTIETPMRPVVVPMTV